MASSAGFPVFQKCANFEQADNFLPDGLHHGLKIDPRECAIADAMPEAKELLAACQQHPTNDLGFTAPLNQGLEIALGMRPTDLAMGGIEPGVSAVAIRTDCTGIVIAQQFPCPAGTSVLKYAEHSHGRGGTHPQP